MNGITQQNDTQVLITKREDMGVAGPMKPLSSALGVKK